MTPLPENNLGHYDSFELELFARSVAVVFNRAGEIGQKNAAVVASWLPLKFLAGSNPRTKPRQLIELTGIYLVAGRGFEPLTFRL
jgi:hypothetical protein